MDCLFHSTRLQFDKMVRSIQQARIIPKPFAGRLGMAVCSCRKNKINIHALMTEEDLHNKVAELKDRLGVEKTWPDSLLDYFYQILSDDISLMDDSKCRFIYVIYQAILHNNYDMLTRAAVSSNIDKEEKPVKKVNNNKPLPKHIIDIIIRRKIRKANVHKNLSLRMFPGNLKSLQESSDYVKLVAENKNSLNVIFNHCENTKHIKNNENQTEAIVGGGDEKSIKEFCTALKQLAIDQQKKMDARYKAIRERRSRRRKRIYNVTVTTDFDDINNNDTNMKDEMTDNYAFTRKKMSQKKSQASAQKTANQSVLAGGHCLSCLKPFDGLKTESGKTPCTYHPGYTYFNVEDKTTRWTCCEEESLDEKPTSEDHAQNGCCSGNHIWRPHKKTSRKPGVNHKEENVGDLAKKLVNQNSVGMSSKNVLSVYNSWFG